MRFRIHRGATEIGGNCIEVQADGKSLLLDLGLPLDAAEAHRDLLPPVAGLADGGNPDLLAVVLSHPHGDHYGLLASAHPSIPVYLGEGARRLLEAAAPFLAADGIRQPVTTYRNREAFTVGPFTVTPYLMDHSAFDAYALLVEADGRKLLYTGDFRAHGRKAWAFDAVLSHPPENVDVLLMEGTVLGRENAPQPVSEVNLEAGIRASITGTEGLVLAAFSAQNIDRLVSFYKATLRSGRRFVADVYTACILDALALPSLPSPSSAASGIRVFLPRRQKARIIRSRRFDLVEPYRRQRVYRAEIASKPDHWVMMFRASMIEDLEAIGGLAGGRLIWSLWPGYLDRDKLDLRDWAAGHDMAFEVQHTSGHAHVGDLKRLAERIAPSCVVPVHTLHPGDFEGLFANGTRYADGEWGSV